MSELATRSRKENILYAVQTARFSSSSTFSIGLAKASEASSRRQAALVHAKRDDIANGYGCIQRVSRAKVEELQVDV
jgi:hypothetical protein